MTEASDAVIVAAVRTPIGRSGRSPGRALPARHRHADGGRRAIAAAGLDPGDIDDLHPRRGPAGRRLHRPLRGQRAGTAARHAGRGRAAPVRHRDDGGAGGGGQHPLGHGRRGDRRRRRVHDPLADALREVALPLRGRRALHPAEPPRHARGAQHEHAHHGGREHRPRVRHHPRGVGRLVVPLQHPGRGRHRRRPLRRGDRAGDRAGGPRRDGDGQRGRAPAAGTRRPRSWRRCRRSRGPTARSPPGTRRASPTAAPPSWWWPAPTPRPTG